MEGGEGEILEGNGRGREKINMQYTVIDQYLATVEELVVEGGR